MYKYIHTCIYIHISFLHTYTHTHIYTHAYKCTYERTQSTSETTARQRLRGQPNLTPRSSALLPVRITTARRPDHICISVLVRSRSTQFIVHTSSQPCHGPLKRGHFSAILAGPLDYPLGGGHGHVQRPHIDPISLYRFEVTLLYICRAYFAYEY